MEKFDQLYEIIVQLRKDCPWDNKQTNQTLKIYLLEEAYEAAEAIDADNDTQLKEELGDILIQILAHIVIASERRAFSLCDVIECALSKLIRRHPHVFGNLQLNSAQQVIKHWEECKSVEGKPKNILQRLPRQLPALLLSYAVLERSQRINKKITPPCTILKTLQDNIQTLIKSPPEEKTSQIIAHSLHLLVALIYTLQLTDPETLLKNYLHQEYANQAF